jgi:hypothetical protein
MRCKVNDLIKSVGIHSYWRHAHKKEELAIWKKCCRHFELILFFFNCEESTLLVKLTTI